MSRELRSKKRRGQACLLDTSRLCLGRLCARYCGLTRHGDKMETVAHMEAVLFLRVVATGSNKRYQKSGPNQVCRILTRKSTIERGRKGKGNRIRALWSLCILSLNPQTKKEKRITYRSRAYLPGLGCNPRNYSQEVNGCY